MEEPFQSYLISEFYILMSFSFIIIIWEWQTIVSCLTDTNNFVQSFIFYMFDYLFEEFMYQKHTCFNGNINNFEFRTHALNKRISVLPRLHHLLFACLIVWVK